MGWDEGVVCILYFPLKSTEIKKKKSDCITHAEKKAVYFTNNRSYIKCLLISFICILPRFVSSLHVVDMYKKKFKIHEFLFSFPISKFIINDYK